MAIKLKIYDQKWMFPRKGYVDDCSYPQNFKRKKILKKNFRGYAEMADWLDENVKYKNKIITVNRIPLKRVGGIRKVVFDGVDTWVEKYGHV